MLQCPVCGNPMEQGGLCAVCGFDDSRNYTAYLSFEIVRNRKSVSALKKAWGTRQKTAYLARVRVEMEVSYYTCAETGAVDSAGAPVLRLAYDHSERVTLLPKAEVLSVDGIYWAAQRFPRQLGEPLLHIKLFVSNGDGERVYRLTVDNPNTKEYLEGQDRKTAASPGEWQLGFRLTQNDTMDTVLLVGNRERYETSESFPLRF